MPEPPLLLSFPYSNISMLRSHLADMYSTRLSAHRIDRTQLNSQPRQVSSYVRQSVSRWLAVWFLACDKTVGNIEKTFNLSPFSLAVSICVFSVFVVYSRVFWSACSYLIIKCFTAGLSPQLIISTPLQLSCPFCIEYPETMQYISTLLAYLLFPPIPFPFRFQLSQCLGIIFLYYF